MNKNKCDLHIHSNFSDGKLSIPEIVNLYGKNNYSIISITDHLCETNSLIGNASHQLGYSLNKNNFSDYIALIKEEAKRAIVEFKMLVLPGFEISKNSVNNSRSAHVLVVGLDSYICPNLSVEEILIESKNKGALTIAAHPFYTGEFEFQSYYLWSRKEKLLDLIDAWEFNYRYKTVGEILNSGLPVIANSDFHHQKHGYSWRTKFVGSNTIEGLRQAIKKNELIFFRENLKFN